MTAVEHTSQPTTVYLEDYEVPPYVIERCDLEFQLDETLTRVTSQLTMKANPNHTRADKKLVLAGEALELESITLNQKKLSTHEYHVTADTLTIDTVPEQFTLTIVTRIKPHENKALTGLYKSSGNFCTQCEAHGFRRITYFLDRPDVMALFTTKIIADKTRYPILLSNGNLIAQGELANNQHWVQWQDPFKKPSYLFALVAGNLECVEDFFVTASGRKVTLRIFVEQGNQHKCAHAMQCVKHAMRWDEETFGREYDLDIYMIVAVSDFNMGAMENKGLNIFNTKYILATEDSATDEDFIHVESVIGHEYFHNWTGNRITCRDWFQLSIKEGLTIFRDQSFTADMTSKTVARIDDVDVLRTSQFSEDAGPLAHPVQPSSYIEINNFYTATVYNKGAEVIRMIQTLLGAELFRRGMDEYFSRYDGQAVTIEHFVGVMEEISGIDLKQFHLWYTQAGTPELTVTSRYDATQQKFYLTIKQSCPPSPQQAHKMPFHIPVKIGLIDQHGNEIAIPNTLLSVKRAEEQFEFNNIKEAPVPSLLRHFSAPVKVHYDYSDRDLQLLFKHDSDGFNRWEAGQRYASNILFRMIDAAHQQQPMSIPNDFIETIQHVITTCDDPLLLSRLLLLPSEKYLGEQMTIVDVDAIHAARQQLQLAMAKQLRSQWLEIYQRGAAKPATKKFDVRDVGQRRLKNIALALLMKLNESTLVDDIALKQFRQSLGVNMTDTLAALAALSQIACPAREAALAEFYQRWKDDALVMDKWFAIQAASSLPDTLTVVKQLTQHPAFDMKNPNKVYALIRTFAQNAVRFHAMSGEGYQFLQDIVCTINDFNPQIAARMVSPLTQWRRYDEKRQALMQAALQKILNKKNISKDVYELASKSIAQH